MTLATPSKPLFSTLLSVMVLCLSVNVGAATFGSAWVFGDSLSDQGNRVGILPTQTAPFSLIPSGPYASGTFSDGEVWVQKLVTRLIDEGELDAGFALLPSALGGNNFAYGFARTGSFSLMDAGEFDMFSVATNVANGPGPLPADGLFIVAGGGNDIRGALGEVALGNFDQGLAEFTVEEGAQNLVGVINALAADGARNFLIPNLADVGRVPEVVGNGQSALARDLTLAFNDELASGLAGIGNPLLNLITVDAFSLTEALFAAPQNFGFSNSTDPCVLENAATGCNNPDEFIFWDGVHPTSAAHQLSANAAFAAIVPLPGAAWLCLSALGLLGLSRRQA